MLTENFKRRENKYMILSDVRKAIEDAICEHMQMDEFGETTITSVYFDDADMSMISRSNEKPMYKEKLRLRTYGTDAGRELMKACGSDYGDDAHDNERERDAECNDTTVFAELKKKYKGIVYKRRVPLELPALTIGSDEMVLDAMSKAESAGHREYSPREWQIGREVQACFDRHAGVAPSVATICERTAWRPQDGADAEKACELRFTFDSELRYADMSGAGFQEVPELDEGTSVMEVKCVGSYPIWLAELLSEQGCYPQGFSKCGTAANRIRSARQKEERGK